MKKYILLIILLLMTTIVSATEICEDSIEANTLCYLLTPVLTGCMNYNYTIYNNTGAVVETNNLTNYNGSIYKINFTQPAGNYIVLLCDDSTREIYVSGNVLSGVNEVKGSMAWIAVAILMVFMTGFLGLGANMIKDKGLQSIKKLLFYFFIINTFMLGIIGFVVSVNSFDSTVFSNLGIGYAGVNLFLMFAFTINYLWLIFYKNAMDGKNNMTKVFKGGKK